MVRRFTTPILAIAFLFHAISLFSQEKTADRKLLENAEKFIYTQPDSAISIAQKIYTKDQVSPKDKISSLLIISNAYALLYDYDKTIKFLLEAKSIAENENDVENSIRILTSLGYQYQGLNMTVKSRFYLKEAEAIMENNPIPDSLRYIEGNIYSVMALGYKNENAYAEAKLYLYKAIKVFKPYKTHVAIANLSVSHFRIGECYLMENNFTMAQDHFKTSLEIAEKNNLDDDIRISPSIGIARIHFMKKKYKEAVEILTDILPVARKLPQVDGPIEVYQMLTESYFQLNDMKNHSHYNSLYLEILETKARLEEKTTNKLVQTLSAEVHNKMNHDKNKTLLYASIVVLLFLSIIFIFLLKYIKIHKKIKKIEESIDQKNENHL